MEYVIAGVFLGALYAVLAGGLVLVYRVSKVLNFAAGSLGTATAYVYWQLTEDWHWSTAAAALVAIACGVVVSGAAGLGSAVAGILISHIATLDPVSLTFKTVPAFVGAAVGVLRRFGLAYVGAIGLGVLYGVLGPYTARPGTREVIAFVLLAGTLLVLSARARPGEVF